MEFDSFELTPKIERARPQLHLFAHNKLWGKFGAQADVLLDAPLPEAITPKEQAVRAVYDTIAALEAVPMDELYLNDPHDDREFAETQARGGGLVKTTRKYQPRPSEISFETFFEHVQKGYLTSQNQRPGR